MNLQKRTGPVLRRSLMERVNKIMDHNFHGLHSSIPWKWQQEILTEPFNEWKSLLEMFISNFVTYRILFLENSSQFLKLPYVLRHYHAL